MFSDRQVAAAEKYRNAPPPDVAGSIAAPAGPMGPEMARPPELPATPSWPNLSGGSVLLDRATWAPMELRHQQQVDELTAHHRARTAEHRAHPVEDFLFTYYSYRPSQLRRWHPGAGTALLDAGSRAEWRFHRSVSAGPLQGQAAIVDASEYLAARGKTVGFIRELLARTQSSPPHFGCFGLHEWAMVFQADELRHLGWPLRLGRAGTDDVVRAHQIRCSHFDAFRFFTPTAKPRNLLAPDLENRVGMEQPACLHASMDLYKWAFRLSPVVSSDLLLDCFRLARQIREVDMRASPYDLTALGYRPITIETAAGKNEYVTAQRDFAARGQALRTRMRGELDRAFGPADAGGQPVQPTAGDPGERTRPGRRDRSVLGASTAAGRGLSAAVGRDHLGDRDPGGVSGTDRCVHG